MLRVIGLLVSLAISGAVLAQECPDGQCEANQARCLEKGGGLATCQRERDTCDKRCEEAAERVKADKRKADEAKKRAVDEAQKSDGNGRK